MIKYDKDGVTISSPATSQDILNLAQAINTARSIRLNNGYVISSRVIESMVNAMDEATASYRKSIQEADDHGKA